MKHLAFVAILLLSASMAKAQTQTYVVHSSCTYSGATASTGTWVRRIDNLDTGAVSAMVGRNRVAINVAPSSKQLFVGYDATVSSVTTSDHYGRILSSGTNEFFISTNIPLYITAEDSAGVNGVRVNVEQCKPQRAAGQ